MSTIHDHTKMRVEGLAGKVALVTGASGGIGREIVAGLRAQGAQVAACDLTAPSIDDALCIAMDVTDRRSVASGVALASRELGTLGVLVTSAGIYQERAFETLDEDAWRTVLDVNLTGTFLCIREVVPSMREARSGRIVTIASGAGLDGGSEPCAHYAASKGGVVVLTKAVAKEYAGFGITVNCVAPRAVRTPMIAGMEETVAPIGRIGEPEDVAAGVTFLCSDHAGYITGEVLVMNGGWW